MYVCVCTYVNICVCVCVGVPGMDREAEITICGRRGSEKKHTRGEKSKEKV